NIITLGVSDLQKSKAFYINGLGWKPAQASNDNIVFFQLNHIALTLYQHEALADDACIEANRSKFRGFSLAYNTRSEKEVDQTLAFAKKAGAQITKPAQKVFWGGYSGYFLDPDGFLWEVAYNPFCTITKDGDIILD
ncbi:MAG: VOC family protein, partial [Pseudomonadota bacterium]